MGFGALRLLVRYKGSFIADKQLRTTSSISSSKCRKVCHAPFASHHSVCFLADKPLAAADQL